MSVDLWGTLVAAQRLVHLNLAGLYAKPTGLITFPGAAVILAPLVALADAASLSLAHPGPHNAQPAVWLVAGPYMIALSAVALFAADALAERLRVSRPKRALLAVVSAVALANVSVAWGHPEDAVAVGLLLYAVLALSDATARSGRVADRGGGRGAAARPAGAARHAGGGRAQAAGRLSGQGSHPSRGTARRRRCGELERHLSRGDQPAELAGHRPSNPVDDPGPAHGGRGGRRRARKGRCCLGRLRVCADRLAQAAHGAARGPLEPGDPPGTALVGRAQSGAARSVRAGDGRLLPVAAAGCGAGRGDTQPAAVDLPPRLSPWRSRSGRSPRGEARGAGGPS